MYFCVPVGCEANVRIVRLDALLRARSASFLVPRFTVTVPPGMVTPKSFAVLRMVTFTVFLVGEATLTVRVQGTRVFRTTPVTSWLVATSVVVEISSPST